MNDYTRDMRQERIGKGIHFGVFWRMDEIWEENMELLCFFLFVLGFTQSLFILYSFCTMMNGVLPWLGVFFCHL